MFFSDKNLQASLKGCHSFQINLQIHCKLQIQIPMKFFSLSK